MARALGSLAAFLVAWALFLSWMANHRQATSHGPWGGTDLPELTWAEAWAIPMAIWLLASWWSFLAPQSLRAPYPMTAVAWRAALLGVAMLMGACLVWLALSLARWSIT